MKSGADARFPNEYNKTACAPAAPGRVRVPASVGVLYVGQHNPARRLLHGQGRS
jgi:hypothetical protein